ncbi:hypothetical protein Vi05172_g1236 [Venturia inaequalis]|nr:hypothetical protein Vi05172_g1236 [Venturia inaequalis]
MQLATLLSLSLAAFSLAPTTTLAVGTAAAAPLNPESCFWNSDTKISQDCCWGGKSDNRIYFPYGYAGCFKQHNSNYDACDTPSYKDDWCSNHNVTEAQCNADCCRVSTKQGMACPL